MEVRLDIDDAFVREMQGKLGAQAKPFDMVRDGLTILRWAIDEAAAGRLILSSTLDGTDLKRLVMPTLALAELIHKQLAPINSDQGSVEPPAVQKCD